MAVVVPYQVVQVVMELAELVVLVLLLLKNQQLQDLHQVFGTWTQFMSMYWKERGEDNMPKLVGAVVATQSQQITTFNSSGTLTTGALTTGLEYLVVAGGGGGGSRFGGGGGAGGLKTNVGGTPTPVSGSTGYAVTIGAGGAGGVASGRYRWCRLWNKRQ